jgi:hypothetical protein
MSRDPALSTSLTETLQVPAEGLTLWRSSNAPCGDCLEECAADLVPLVAILGNLDLALLDWFVERRLINHFSVRVCDGRLPRVELVGGLCRQLPTRQELRH